MNDTTALHPLVNAILNGSSAVLLLAGLVAIKAGHRDLHAWLMRVATFVSAVFLVSYLLYHFGTQKELGPTPFRGTPTWKTAYLVMLASHVILAVVNVPLVLRVLWLAHRERWEAHKRLAKITFPIWLYVSVTGVLVYFALYVWNPPS